MFKLFIHNAALTGAFALIMAATATIISAKRLSNVLLSGSVAERKSPDNRMFDRFPVNAALSGPWSDSGRVLITPKSDAVGRCSMNSGIALNFDIKMTFENELRCQRSAGFFCYVLVYVNHALALLFLFFYNCTYLLYRKYYNTQDEKCKHYRT